MSEWNKSADQPTNDSTAHESLDALYDSVEQELRNIDTSFRGVEIAWSYGAYHQAAAVLSAFELNKIRPAGTPAADEKIEDLLADSVLVYDEPQPPVEPVINASLDKDTNEYRLSMLVTRVPRWTLQPDIRRRVIQQMRTRDAFLHALEANPQRGNDAMQRMIDAYVRNETLPISSQSVEELACTAQVAEWFDGYLDNLPKPQEIAQQLDAKRLLQPFEKLVGQHFSGREEQLRQLRDYVGVLPPGTWFGSLRRNAEKLLNAKKNPLMIHGPGGVGKSTLVAKFILEHATLSATQRFPYAYLDFDRPGLLAEEPATLLVEAVRQLGIQYPDVREHSERVRHRWQQELAQVARHAQNLGPESSVAGTSRLSKQQRTNLLRDFEALLGAMGLSDEPFLLVLDTFEEVQYRSLPYISQLWDALDELRSIVPRLRTVFSGRAPLNGFKTQEVALNDLDAAAAKGFLTASKITPESLVDTIVKRTGGNPLNLRLAVQVFHNEGGASEEFFSRLQKDRIQSALYTRVLEHIHEPDVMKLAHPGLILRRITPGLILQVLAEPCGVEVDNLDEAEKLFGKLSQEFTLVVPGGTTAKEPHALRHAPEVRRGMIGMLREDEKQKSKILTIQRNAIAYYQPFDDPVSRAEEIYHRLALKDDHAVIALRWIDGVKDNLFNALEELDPIEQAFLAARLEVDVEDDVLAQADPADWEAIAGRRASNFLKLGQPERALAVLGQRVPRLSNSPLFVLEAQAYEQQMKLSEAREIVAQGLRSATEANTVRYDLLLLAGRLDRRLQNNEGAFKNWNNALELASQMQDNVRIVEVSLELLRPGLCNRIDDCSSVQLQKQLKEALGRIPDPQLAEHLGMLRHVIDVLGEEDDALLTRAIRLVGFESANQTQLRSLARAVAEWDLAVSSTANSDPGLLARMARVPLRSEISDSWKQFMQTAPPTRVKDAVLLLLDRYPMPPSFRTVLVDILRLPLPNDQSAELPETLSAGSSRAAGTSTTPITLNLTLDEKQSLMFALTSAFTRESLAQMLYFRMDLNLDSISLTDTFSSTVEYLVRYAETHGLLVHLVTAARESNPGNIYLANFARKFGLMPDSGIEESLESSIYSHSTLSADQWRARLGEMSGRVCRVEVGTGDDAVQATGFLVGPNVLVTSYQALEGVINGAVQARDVSFRFDFKMYSGTTVNDGTVYRLQREDWLVVSSTSNQSLTENDGQFNFALVRLEGVPGREPIGGERAEPGAPPRGWIYIDPDKAVEALQPERLMLLHYPPNESLKLVVADNESIRTNAQRLYYSIEADSLSTGAPCFNSNWDLVGLHGGLVPGSTAESYGVMASTVIAELQRSGFDVLGARDKFEATVLRGNRVFLNRAALRKAIREMVDPEGRRILIVNGPRGSGKTYTREFILDVTYNMPSHRVIYIDMDSSDFGPAELAQTIAYQIGSDVGQIPVAADEPPLRAIQRLCNYLMAGFGRNTSITWWLIFDGFSRPLRPDTDELIRELTGRTTSHGLRIVLLNYTSQLTMQLSERAIREEIKPIDRTDVETFIVQQLQQHDPAITSEKIKAIVEHVLSTTDDASSREIYPTENRLRILNRAITNAVPRAYI